MQNQFLLYVDDLILLSESENGFQRWQMRITIKKAEAIIFITSAKIFRSDSRQVISQSK